MTARFATPDDFKIEWNENTTYDFFEDESATWVWAHGLIDDQEFVRQVNEYDEYCNGAPLENLYTIEDVRRDWAVAVDNIDANGEPYTTIRVVPEGTIAGLVARIAR